MAKKSPVTGLAGVLKKVLAERGLDKGLVVAELDAVWLKAVGSGVATHARPDAIKGGKLTVIVDSSAWMNQLSMLSPRIIEQVNEALGREEVKTLAFRTGKVESASGKKAPEEKIKTRPLTPEETAEIEEAISVIKDEETREAARKLFASSCARKV
jgi:predicted nucleic acid-binding Zn ribbon protein